MRSRIMSNRLTSMLIATAAILVIVATLLPGTDAEAMKSDLQARKYESVGYGLYEVRTKNAESVVNLRMYPRSDAYVIGYAKNGTRYIALQNLDGWVLVIEPCLYEQGRSACKYIWVDYLVDVK